MTEGTIGMIACEMMEDELIAALHEDQDVRNVVVIDDGEGGKEGSGLLRKLPLLKPDVHMVHSTIADLGDVGTRGSTAIVWMKPMALHENPEELRDDITDALKVMGAHCDLVLLFYGLCGNAFTGLEDMEEKADVPILIIRDSKGQIVDDCIGAVLGGTDEYLKCLKKFKGAFFLTPMWASNWREMLHKVRIMTSEEDIEGARYIFEAVGYDKVVKIETGLGDPDEFSDKVDEFATVFDFERHVLKGDLSLIHAAYNKAKEILGSVDGD